MNRFVLPLAAMGALTFAVAPALAVDGASIHQATYDSHHAVRIEEVHHHGYHGYYHGGFAPVIVAPAPVYTVPVYPPTVTVPVVPAPTVVYPPTYPYPGYYYAYPRGYVGYRGRGLSIGIGL